MSTPPPPEDPVALALSLARGRRILAVPGLAQVLREAAGLSRADMIRSTGASRASIMRYEQGGKPVDDAGANYVAVLAALAEHYGDELDEPWRAAWLDRRSSDDNGDASKDDPRRLLDAKQVAGQLGIAPSTFWQMRGRGEAPPAIRIGGSVKWSQADLDRWIEGRREDDGSA